MQQQILNANGGCYLWGAPLLVCGRSVAVEALYIIVTAGLCLLVVCNESWPQCIVGLHGLGNLGLQAQLVFY
jgi:hypothetical protein